MIVEIYVIRTATKITFQMTKRDIIHSPFRMYIIRGRWYIAYMYMYHNWYVVIRLQHLRINEVFFNVQYFKGRYMYISS